MMQWIQNIKAELPEIKSVPQLINYIGQRGIVNNIKFIGYIVVLVLLYITLVHRNENQLRNLTKTSKQLKELGWEYKDVKSHFMFLTKESELAKFILDRIPFIDKLRFLSSGTEAVMSAIRLARGYTNKTKIVKFDGCYHGHVDALLVKAGSGLVTFGTSSSAGVPEAFANETIVLPLNDLDALKSCFEALSDEIACVIIEPIPANNGLLLQDLSFLTALRALCTEYGILLIFDEVISGFRVAFGGASEYYKITPDIVTYGKIMGGGLPVGAYGAKREIMSFVSPDGPVYQAGTLSGNPVAMAAGIAQLSLCAQENFYEELEKKTTTFVEDINNFANTHELPVELVSIGSIFWFSFNGKKRIAAADQIDADMTSFNKLHHFLLNRGVYFGPSGYEVGFISSAHTTEQLAFSAEQIKEGLEAIYQ